MGFQRTLYCLLYETPDCLVHATLSHYQTDGGTYMNRAGFLYPEKRTGGFGGFWKMRFSQKIFFLGTPLKKYFFYKNPGSKTAKTSR